jgi:hypothetical protein
VVRALAWMVAASLLAVGTAACQASPPAATIGGTTITQAELDAALASVQDSPAAQCALEVQAGTLPPLAGAGGDAVTQSFAAGELSTLVELALLDEELHRLHVVITAGELAAARADVARALAQAASAGLPCAAAIPNLARALPRSFLAQQVRFEADGEALVARIGHVDLGKQALARYYAEHVADFTQDCLAAIALPTQAAAEALRPTLDASNFAAVARARSIDAATAARGGSLGCVAETRLAANPALAATIAGLAPGQVSEPLAAPTQAGGTVWVLLELTRRVTEPLRRVEPQIRAALLESHATLLSSLLDRLVRRARVWVDPRYGHWDGRAFPPVVAPTPPPGRLVPEPFAGALGGSGS